LSNARESKRGGQSPGSIVRVGRTGLALRGETKKPVLDISATNIATTTTTNITTTATAIVDTDANATATLAAAAVYTGASLVVVLVMLVVRRALHLNGIVLARPRNAAKVAHAGSGSGVGRHAPRHAAQLNVRRQLVHGDERHAAAILAADKVERARARARARARPYA
jgi:hypothetical protein